MVTSRQEFTLGILARISDADNPVKTSTVAGYISRGFLKQSNVTDNVKNMARNDLNVLRSKDMVVSYREPEEDEMRWCINKHGMDYVERHSKLHWIKLAFNIVSQVKGVVS